MTIKTKIFHIGHNKALTKKEKIVKLNYIKIKNLGSSKTSFKIVKRQATKYEKILAINTFHKGPLLIIYK